MAEPLNPPEPHTPTSAPGSAKVRVRTVRRKSEPKRYASRGFQLPDWSKATWVFVVGLSVLVLFAMIAVIADLVSPTPGAPPLAQRWTEALFGTLAGIFRGGQ